MEPKLQIIVGHRGWVHVGKVTEETNSDVTLENARCVRRWGTDQGLAQLCKTGPRDDTILDAPATMHIHPLAIIHRYDCDLGAWDGKL